MKKSAFLKILVALAVISSILLSSILGITKAEYYKTLSKTLDFESKPDLMLEYYLYDANAYTGTGSTVYEGENGVYENAESFTQTIVIGTKDNTDKQLKMATSTGGYESNKAYVKCGKSIVYQIKIPVDETGYYTLDYNSRFNWGPNATSNLNQHTYTISAIYSVGCEVLTASDNVNFFNDSNPMPANYTFDLSRRQFLTKDNNIKYSSTEPLLYADSTVNSSNTIKDATYIWKTLAPSRSENVRLAFKVEQADVDRGYVIWSWDLYGLKGERRYTLVVNSLSITKTMELASDLQTNMGNEPYFVFPQTSYVNNNVISNGTNGAGHTRITSGRGTYITEATENSLGMRAEMLHATDATDGIAASTADQNPIGIYIPLKNIQFDTTYKVTFDISVAKQGQNSINTDTGNDRYLGNTTDWHEYTPFSHIFNLGDDYFFQSYLQSGLTPSATISEHQTKQGQIEYADKSYDSKPLVKYDEVTSLTNIDHTTTLSVNNTYCNDYTHHGNTENNKGQSRNWFNAVQHTEYNGEYAIRWITFYNTTFSFNIPKSQNSSLNINDLYWVWAIEALKYTAFYNIRIENVRIEKVVKYTSYLDVNGVSIAGQRVFLADQAVKKNDNNLGYDPTWDVTVSGGSPNIFTSFRGINGTGQQYRAKGFTQDNGTTTMAGKVFTAEGNIYAPIIDVKKMSAIGTANQPYQIALDGAIACEGGINKYVFSIDGGKSWEDMTFTGKDIGDASDKAIRLNDLARGVNQWTSGQTPYGPIPEGSNKQYPAFPTDGNINNFTHLDGAGGLFTEQDGVNGYFSYSSDHNGGNWCLVADLSEYKYMANLDIIIAAVPLEDPNMRCEILRIINFNQSPNYVSYVNNIYSDIRVKNAATNETNNLNASYLGREANVDATKEADNTTKFSIQRGWDLTANAPGYTDTGYSLHTSKSTKYSDIRTLYSDISVKQWLGVQGWFFVSGDTRNVFKDYGWSVDGGVTWYDGSKSARGSIVAQLDATKLLTLQTDKANQPMIEARQTYENKWSLNHKLTNANQGKFFTGYVTKNTDTYSATVPEQHLTLAFEANLADFEGQVVDIIFGGRAEGSDVYCPIAKIDNVAVYGETGTFYSQISEIRTSPKAADYIYKKNSDGKTDSYPNKLSEINNVSNLLKDSNKRKINLSGGWNQNIIKSSASYSHFETQNVNAVNARLLGDEVLHTEKGARIFIKGEILCNNTITGYKFTLNGGVDWMDVPAGHCNLTTSSPSSTIINGNSNYVDVGLTGTTKGSFTTVPVGDSSNDDKIKANDEKNTKAGLSFNLPALDDDDVRNCLVVAVGKDGDNDEKMYPIAHFKIQQDRDEDIGAVNRSTNKGLDVDNYPAYYSGGVKSSSTWGSINPQNSINSDGTNNLRHRISLPVNQVGKWRLDIQHNMSDESMSPDTLEKEYATLAFVRDASYYSDLDRQIDHLDPNNSDIVTLIKTIDDPYGTQNELHITYDIDITQEDVRRGFIILDADYTHLYADGITTNLYRDIDGDGTGDLPWKFLGAVVPEQSQISLGGTANSEQYLQIPVDQTGTYKLKYSTVVGMGITKKGVNKIGINEIMAYNGNQTHTYTNLNYGNASLSVSKNIFVEGEPITVTYNTAGSVCGETFSDGYTNNNKPWIGITREIEGKDRYVNWARLEPEASGRVTFVPNSSANNAENDAAKEYVSLPPGTYKIYLRDNAAKVYRDHDGSYWDAYNMVQPIEIKVVSKTNPDYTMSKSFSNSWKYTGLDNKYNGTFSGQTGSVTLNNTLFRIGGEIKLTTSNLSDTLKNSGGDWFAIYPVDSNSFVSGCWQYVDGNSETSITIPDSVTPGTYRVVYLHGNNLTNAITAGAVLAEFYINIVPKDSSITASVESLDAQTKASMGEMTDIWTYQTTNEVSVSVTANDVTNGYIRIKFDVAGLPGNNYGCMLTVDDLSFLRQGD